MNEILHCDRKGCDFSAPDGWERDLAAEIAVCHDATTLGGHRVPEVQKWTL